MPIPPLSKISQSIRTGFRNYNQAIHKLTGESQTHEIFDFAKRTVGAKQKAENILDRLTNFFFRNMQPPSSGLALAGVGDKVLPSQKKLDSGIKSITRLHSDGANGDLLGRTNKLYELFKAIKNQATQLMEQPTSQGVKEFKETLNNCIDLCRGIQRDLEQKMLVDPHVEVVRDGIISIVQSCESMLRKVE